MACSGAVAQNWNSGVTTGLTSVDFLQSGNDYTITLHNLSGTSADTNSPDYDVIVWSLELFNFYTPDEGSILAPTGWTWDSAKCTFVVTPSQKYKTGPSLAPGGTFTFNYHSSASALSNTDSHAPMNGVLAHVGAVDPTKPGSSTVQWTAVGSPYGPTWSDQPGNDVPEPGSLMSLAGAMVGALGLTIRRRK
jgi:hypothetical protein